MIVYSNNIYLNCSVAWNIARGCEKQAMQDEMLKGGGAGGMRQILFPDLGNL